MNPDLSSSDAATVYWIDDRFELALKCCHLVLKFHFYPHAERKVEESLAVQVAPLSNLDAFDNVELKAQVLKDTFEDVEVLSRIELAENYNELDADQSDLPLKSLTVTTKLVLMKPSCLSDNCWSTVVTYFCCSLKNSYWDLETTPLTADGNESPLFFSLMYLCGLLVKTLSIQLKEE